MLNGLIDVLLQEAFRNTTNKVAIDAPKIELSLHLTSLDNCGKLPDGCGLEAGVLRRSFWSVVEACVGSSEATQELAGCSIV